MDQTMIADTVGKKFNAALRQIKKSDALYKRIRDGTAVAEDLLELSALSGKTLGKITTETLIQMLNDSAFGEDLTNILAGGFETNHNFVADAAEQFLTHSNSALGIGIKPAAPLLNYDRISGIASEIMQSDSISAIAQKLIAQYEELSMSHVDDAMRLNAEVMDNLGFETLVVREFHPEETDQDAHHDSGYWECEWCKERATDGMPYKEAYDAGVFERHDGCHCVIYYITNKTVERGTGNGTSWNFR